MSAFLDTVALSEGGAWVHLIDMQTKRPAYADDEEAKPVRIRRLGPDSVKLQERLRRRAAAMAKAEAGRQDIGKMAEAEIVAMIERREASAIHDAADATIGWENVPGPDGKPLAYSEAAAVELYTRFPAIRRQVIEMGALDAFIEAAAKG